MARPREFDEEDVISKAMVCFWEKGYDAASIKDLEMATGVSRISLYNTFKDKEGLFISVLDKYHAIGSECIDPMLEESNTTEGIIQLFEMIGNPKPDEAPEHHGCLIVNTILNVNNIGENILNILKEYRNSMHETLKNYIERLKANGTIRQDINTEQAATYLQTSMWGAMAITRLYSSSEHTKSHTDMVIYTIKSWEI